MSDEEKFEYVLRESSAQLKAAYGDLRSVPSSVRQAVIDHYWTQIDTVTAIEVEQ